MNEIMLIPCGHDGPIADRNTGCDLLRTRYRKGWDAYYVFKFRSLEGFAEADRYATLDEALTFDALYKAVPGAWPVY